MLLGVTDVLFLHMYVCVYLCVHLCMHAFPGACRADLIGYGKQNNLELQKQREEEKKKEEERERKRQEEELKRAKERQAEEVSFFVCVPVERDRQTEGVTLSRSLS